MNIADLADRFQIDNGITEEELDTPCATLAFALIDKDGKMFFDPNRPKKSGLSLRRTAKAVFDPTGNANHQGVGAHGLRVTLPINAIVIGGFVQVVTALTSLNSTATVALNVQGANDLVTAAAVSGAPFSTTGLKAIVPKANTPESTGIALTAARELTATVAVEALTGGKLNLFIDYVIGG